MLWLSEFLIAVGVFAAPMQGNCHLYQFNGIEVTRCHYKPVHDPELLTVIGKHWALGPWATDDDIINPALLSLAGKRTVVLNVHIGGDAIITMPGPGLISNVFMEPLPGCVAGVSIKGE